MDAATDERTPVCDDPDTLGQAAEPRLWLPLWYDVIYVTHARAAWQEFADKLVRVFTKPAPGPWIDAAFT